jgi:hypothetical protein
LSQPRRIARPRRRRRDPVIQSLCDDRWRLNRAATFESCLFADAAEKLAESADATGNADLDTALSQGQTWIAEARNLNLLTLYESRIQRRLEKNRAELCRLQDARQAALAQAIEEAALLSYRAEIKGETYNPADAFTLRNFEFSAGEIARMVSRWRRLLEAKQLSALSKNAQSGGVRKAA